MKKVQTINLLEFLSKNFFWYAIVSLITGSFNPSNWWFTQFFWGGALFALFEIILLGSCVKEIEEKNEDGN